MFMAFLGSSVDFLTIGLVFSFINKDVCVLALILTKLILSHFE